MIMYVTEMLLKGQRHINSYVLGVYSTAELARDAGTNEALLTNNTYEPVVSKFEVDKPLIDYRGP